jgi:hypothetical protein
MGGAWWLPDIHARGKVGSEEAVGCVDTFEGDSYV